ncbi:MAG: hypothetical protein R3F30_05900 [Planctomycetota bacterium]
MKLRRLLFTTGLILTLLLLGTYVLLTGTGLTRSLVRDILSDFIKGRLSIEDATMDPIGGRVRIKGIRLSEGDERDRKVLEVPEIVIDVDVNPFGSVGEVSTVRIEGAELDLWLGEAQVLDLDKLFHLDTGGTRTGRIPALELVDAKVRLHLPAADDLVLELSPIQLQALPDATMPGRHVIRGECPNPLGGKIVIEGTGLPEKGQLRLLVKAEEFHVDAAEVAVLGPELRRFVEKFELEGLVLPTFWLAYPDEEGRLQGGLVAKVRDFSVTPPTFRYRLHGLEGNVELSPDDGGTVQIRANSQGDSLPRLSGDVRVENIAGVDEVRVRVEAEGLPVDARLDEALSGIPVAARVLDAFAIRDGTADGRFYLHAGQRDPGTGDGMKPHIQLDLDVEGVHARFDGFPPEAEGARRVRFPYELEVLSGRVEVRDGHIRIPEERPLVARGPTGAAMRLSGEVDAGGEDAGQWLDLRIGGRAVPFDEDLRRPLAALLGEEDRLEAGTTLYDEFAPRGSADLNVVLSRTPGDPRITWRCDVFPRAAEVRWSGFPYTVGALGGRLRLDPGQIDLDLQGVKRFPDGREASIEVRGNLVLPEEIGGDPGARVGRRLDGEVRVAAKGIVLDDELRKALEVRLDPELVDRQWTAFSPGGVVDLEFLGWRPTGDAPLEYDLEVHVRDGQARFERFRADLARLRGTLALRGTRDRSRLEVLGFTARSLGGDLLFHGAMDFVAGMGEGRGLGLDLSILGKGIAVDDELRRVLALEGMLEPRVWDRFRPSGRIDVVQRVRRDLEDEAPRNELILDLRRMRSEAEILPDVLHEVSGEVRVGNDRVVRLRDVEGMVGEAAISCREGTISVGPETTVMEFVLGADHYPVDERLGRLLQGQVRQAYLDRKAHGHCSFRDLGLRIELPRVPPDDGTLGLEVRFDGPTRIEMHDLSLDAGAQIRSLDGPALLEHGRFGGGQAEFSGSFDGLRFEALGQVFEDGRGPWRASEHDFEIGNTARVRVHSGRLLGLPAAEGEDAGPVFRYDFGEAKQVEAGVRLEAVDLAALLRPLKLSQEYRGHLDGWLRLGGALDDPTTFRLEGRIALGGDRANLGSVPIFRSIYQAVRPERRPVFRKAEIEFVTGDKELQIPYLFLASPILEVRGRGKVTFDGYLTLEIDFPNLFPEAVLVPEIFQAISNAIVQYDIYGYLGNTRTSPRFLLEGAPPRQPYLPKPGRASRRPPLFQ